VEVETNRKYVAYRMAPLLVTFSDLESHLLFENFLSSNVRGQGHLTLTRFFCKFDPNYILGICEARHFRFHALIDVEE